MSSDRDPAPAPPPAGDEAGARRDAGAGPAGAAPADPAAAPSPAEDGGAPAARRDPGGARSSEHAPAVSGSIDVVIDPGATATMAAVSSGSSGSIDIAMSGPALIAPGDERGAPPRSDAPPRGEAEIAERPAGRPTPARPWPATSAAELSHLSRRLGDAARDALGEGVTKLGSGIGTLGEGISRLGERSHKVPLVGPSVAALGEGISTVGESLTGLPRMARTRQGRLLVRSTLVAFLLVFAWIVVIVALQVRGVDAPNFRPTAEAILRNLSRGSAGIEQVYEEASPRFQEMARKAAFIDHMTDMTATIGAFREIAALNESLVTTGPAGRIGRVSLTVVYERGKTRATVSLHWHQGRWRLLGIGVDVPAELKITKAQREERVQACKDPMDPKRCDLFAAASHVLEQLRDGKAAQVWDAASTLFQKQEERSRFVMLQAEHATTLGEYRRIIAVTEAKLYSAGLTAAFDVLTEYARSQGVRATFGFERASKQEPWKLRSLKVVLPMPRADEPRATAPEARPVGEPLPPPPGAPAP